MDSSSYFLSSETGDWTWGLASTKNHHTWPRHSTQKSNTFLCLCIFLGSFCPSSFPWISRRQYITTFWPGWIVFLWIGVSEWMDIKRHWWGGGTLKSNSFHVSEIRVHTWGSVYALTVHLSYHFYVLGAHSHSESFYVFLYFLQRMWEKWITCCWLITIISYPRIHVQIFFWLEKLSLLSRKGNLVHG
jgi:hypothetical protein